ncbi:MAG: PIN domain nuclease [Acidimicrobiales bacterium]
MAGVAVLLADTSAWHRASHPAVVQRWLQAMAADRLGVCDPVRLELLYSTRSAAEYAAREADLDSLRQVDAGAPVFRRALEVQRRLGERAALHHRSVKIPDLLIAAAAELGDATVWHYDEDFDRIAAITGQPTEWIAARGTL